MVTTISALATSACKDKSPRPSGDIQPAQRIQLDTNKSVELIGLRWWSPEMIQDSLAKYAPGKGLDAPDVASILRNRIHFADAAVHSSEQVFDENESTQYTVVLREPADSARVHFRPQHLDSAATYAPWSAITRRLGGPASHLFEVVSAYQLEGPQHTVVDSSDRAHPHTLFNQVGYPFDSSADSVAAWPILTAIAALKRDADFAAARQIVATSNSEIDRMLAALVLANFASRDDAWRALLDESIGFDQRADAATAWQALAAMSERKPRTVDWTPVAREIHDVLDGTAVAALPAIARTLVRTGAGPKDAAAFLAGGGEILTAYLESANTDLSEPAHQLLVALRGSDLGTEVGPWRAWIRTLSRS
ncbi:MAG TPA: hypothetical protein VIV65_06040 [Gemmatimonadaceae bacterium]